MAKCRECNTEIPEGAEYCDNCLSKLNTAKDSESYLDSLLNAVMTAEPERREIAFQKREADSPLSASKKEKTAPKKAESIPLPEEEELPDLKEYSIFQEMDEADVERMLDADLQEEFGKDLTGEDLPEEVLSGNEAAEADEGALEDLADLFAGGEEAGPNEPDRGEEDLPEQTVSEEVEAEPEDGREEAETVPKAEAAEDAGLDALLSGLDEMKEETSVAEEESSNSISDGSGLDPDLAELLAGFGEEGAGLFEFGAEPTELDESLESGSADKAKDIPTEPQKTKDDQAEEAEPAGKKKKGKGRISALYHKLFDNVKVDPSKVKPQPTKEEIEAKKKAAQEAKERSKEEKEALLAEKKEQERQAKAEKQRRAREAKAEKKARKLEEAKLLLEEMDNTRINRAGASIVFIFFAMIAVVIVVGTSIFSYSLSIRNAEYEFNRDEYTLAYNEIFGLEIKDEDIVLYDRIMTVMYVQKQLNSYYNYYEMKDYPKALDSLLKGLQRYEKYIELAVELDIESDLDSVRNEILTEIDASFSLSEQEAMEIIQS
ncbi:MAG: hypothetical protein ACI4QX_03800, partial [Lachnospiraceae bacterium]